MITREHALELIREHVKNENIVKHMLALESVMGGLYDELRSKNHELWEKQSQGTKEEWMMAGLLHDGDYCEGVPMERQGVQITDWAKEKNLEVPDNVAHAMAAHNWSNTKVEPKDLMDWSIFCADSLTGLVVASALVRPDRKLESVTVESVMKKFRQPSFAKGTRREDIELCKEKLGMELDEFIRVALSAMQGISSELGL